MICGRRRRQRCLLSKQISQLTEPGEIEEYVRLLLQSVLTNERSHNFSEIFSILKVHNETCEDPRCLCEKILKMSYHSEELMSADALQNLINENSDNFDMSESSNWSQPMHRFFRLILCFVEESFQISEQSCERVIIKVQLQYNYLEKIYLALYNLQLATELNPSFSEDFMIYKLTCDIERKLREINRNESSSKLNHIDELVELQEKIMEFQDRLIDSSLLYIKFWGELQKDTPRLKEVSQIGFDIATNLEKINDLFLRISNNSQKIIRISILYAIFLSKVVQDSISANEKHLEVIRIMDNYKIKKISELENYQLVNGGEAAIVIMSGNRSNFGIVQNTNQELNKILGYEKDQILFQNVNVIMPHLISKHHNNLIYSFFEKNAKAGTLSKNMDVLAQHAQGYLQPCTLSVRIVPNFQNGIQFIGFLNFSLYVDAFRQGDQKVGNSEVILFLLDSNYCIHGFNKTYLDFSNVEINPVAIGKYIQNDQLLSFKDVYPFLFSSENEYFIRSMEGLDLPMDLILLNNHLLPEISDDSPSEKSEVAVNSSCLTVSVSMLTGIVF